MSSGATATLAFALAVVLVLILTPQAARLAAKTGFLDHPLGYKQHGRATPYLGGSAVMLAFLVAALLWGGLDDRFLALGLGACALWIVGTLDDRFNLSPYLRMAVEALAAVSLWTADLGWTVFSSDVLNLLLTIVWVVGLVNAFNLMDNLDGATGTVAASAAIGIAGFAFLNDDAQLAAIAAALAGACIGFLRYNLARPARIFLGDGGSMPVGFIAAAAAIAAASGVDELGASAVLCAAMVAGLVILDTTLVVVSRTRRGVPLLTGGRDHLTHRLLTVTGTPQAVAVMLAALGLALCAVALMAAASGRTAVLWSAAATLLIGIAVIAVLEIRFGVPQRAPVPAGSRE